MGWKFRPVFIADFDRQVGGKGLLGLGLKTIERMSKSPQTIQLIF